MKNILIILITVFLFSCGDNDNPPVIDVDSEDQKMNAAIKQAKTSLDQFFENYESIENDGYSLKFGLQTSDGNIEHIWFNPIEVDGDTIKAKCANEPRDIPDLKLGDIRYLKRDQITDWMIVSGNKCYGCYTVRVLAKKNPKYAPPYKYVDF